MENIINNEMPQNEIINDSVFGHALSDFEQICCDTFSNANIEKLKLEIMDEILAALPPNNDISEPEIFHQADELLHNVQPDPAVSADDQTEKSEFSDQSEQSNQLSREVQTNPEGFENKGEDTAEIFQQTNELLHNLQQDPEDAGAAVETQPEESNQINLLLQSLPQNSVDSVKVKLQEPDLFRQADQLLQVVQPEAAIAAQTQLQNSRQKSLKDIEPPYDFDFVW